MADKDRELQNHQKSHRTAEDCWGNIVGNVRQAPGRGARGDRRVQKTESEQEPTEGFRRGEQQFGRRAGDQVPL